MRNDSLLGPQFDRFAPTVLWPAAGGCWSGGDGMGAGGEFFFFLGLYRLF